MSRYKNRINHFFNNFFSAQEQQLLNNLIAESITIYGQSMYYIPRVINRFDPLYTEDSQSSYESAFMIPIYIENPYGFKGDGEYLSKFGIEIRDRVIFSVSRDIFSQEVGVNVNQPRPDEGDLIYFPLNQKCFQVKYVNKFELFYALGSLYTWKMECELFEYSGERITTGIPQIDILQTEFDLNVIDWNILTQGFSSIMDESNNYICIEGSGQWQKTYTLDESQELQTESQKIIDFSVLDPFSNGNIGTPIGS
jgi:hypothetical protein